MPLPYNPGGVFSLIASYFATPGATIRTEQHNPVFEDVASALSSVLLRDGRAPMTGPLNMNGQPINNAVAGNSPSSVATLAQSVPIGGIIDFAGGTAPAGWALCYGQAISRVIYAELFALIGVIYGAGDGSTTFNLPDLRGRTSIGPDNMGGTSANRAPGYTITAAGGEFTHALSVGELPVLNPQFQGAPTAVSVTSTRSDILINPGVLGFNRDNTVQALTPGSVTQITSTGTITPLGSIVQFGGGVAHNNMQPSLAISKIIRVSYNG